MGNFTEYLVLVASLLGGFASLIIILRLLLGPIYTRLKHIEDQVTNYIPSQYKELDLKFTEQIKALDQKFTEQIKEVKSDLKALDLKFTEQIKEVKSDLKALDQKVDKLAEQLNHRLDTIFEVLMKIQERK